MHKRRQRARPTAAPELVGVEPPEGARAVDRVGAVEQQRAGGDARAVGQRVGRDGKLGVLRCVVYCCVCGVVAIVFV